MLLTGPGQPDPCAPSCPGTPVPRRRRPCVECPWRRDVAAGQFSRESFDAMRATTGTDGHEAWLDAPMFACHKSAEDGEEACAGWLAAVGHNHLGVRAAVAFGRLDADALEPGTDWPDLHRSYEEMVESKVCDQSG